MMEPEEFASKEGLTFLGSCDTASPDFTVDAYYREMQGSGRVMPQAVFVLRASSAAALQAFMEHHEWTGPSQFERHKWKTTSQFSDREIYLGQALLSPELVGSGLTSVYRDLADTNLDVSMDTLHQLAAKAAPHHPWAQSVAEVGPPTSSRVQRRKRPSAPGGSAPGSNTQER